MSLQYAKGEKVFAQYDYATFGYHKKTAEYTMSKSLIVTNRRVVHQAVSHQGGKKAVIRKQIPLEHAKFVDVATSRISKPGLLVAAIIFAVIAFAAYLVGNIPPVQDKLGQWAIAFPIGAGVFGFVALMFLLGYILSFRTYLACSIDIDCPVNNAIDFTSKSVNRRKADARTDRQKIQFNLRVNSKVAMKMADELGAVILDAMAYVPDEEPVAEESVEEAPAACEEIPAEEIAAEETAPEAPEEESEAAPEEAAE